MKVRIIEDPETEEGIAIITVRRITPEIERMKALMEEQRMRCFFNGRERIVKASSIIMARTEECGTMLHIDDGTCCRSSLPLYRIEETLGKEFIRLSKWAIVRLSAVDSITVHLSGRTEVHLLSGISETLTRKYRASFKERIVK